MVSLVRMLATLVLVLVGFLVMLGQRDRGAALLKRLRGPAILLVALCLLAPSLARVANEITDGASWPITVSPLAVATFVAGHIALGIALVRRKLRERVGRDERAAREATLRRERVRLPPSIEDGP